MNINLSRKVNSSKIILLIDYGLPQCDYALAKSLITGEKQVRNEEYGFDSLNSRPQL